MKKKKDGQQTVRPFVLALPIFPARLQASIFGRSELNFRVRNGNGWTLALISTYFTFSEKKVSKENSSFSLLTVFSTVSIIPKISLMSSTFSHQKMLWKMVTRTGIEPMFAA